ncbi:hypothetical protein ASPZODRAFT_135539 [Penicilliopsis zonata CBS 506.65]|uniref:Increased recombination centers protein 6 n=1 Tax=Penicilliopsis zonata CBS 506.65 TaxID=1073090 RepID=A0A1L9SA75_9EURO|nr:hypothetical protein ASPZODRAFT_135539 [Penicilliopsis zonata CBS 506.65]OJJ44082.1 hypothetical protein ASPZODRAFT_135539 [Penicilliopsis zonata CBS 506.65]
MTEISNPRRLLILSPPSHSQTVIPPFLKSLTGVLPETETGSFAGYTTHPALQLRTKYYAADVPVWVDEIPLEKAAQQTWTHEFSGSEARIVRDAIGAVAVCVQNHDGASVEGVKPLLKAVGEVKSVIETERGMGEVPGLLVLVGKVTAPIGEESENEPEDFTSAWWEDQLCELGLMEFEVVVWDPKGKDCDKRNVFGEYEGMRRVREVLETHEWEGDQHHDDDLEKTLLGLDGEQQGFELEVDELEREMLGLRFAMGREESGDGQDDDEEIKAESLEALMVRMKAIRDMSAELPVEERRKFAAKAVGEIMKEL